MKANHEMALRKMVKRSAEAEARRAVEKANTPRGLIADAIGIVVLVAMYAAGYLLCCALSDYHWA